MRPGRSQLCVWSPSLWHWEIPGQRHGTVWNKESKNAVRVGRMKRKERCSASYSNLSYGKAPIIAALCYAAAMHNCCLFRWMCLIMTGQVKTLETGHYIYCLLLCTGLAVICRLSRLFMLDFLVIQAHRYSVHEYGVSCKQPLPGLVVLHNLHNGHRHVVLRRFSLSLSFLCLFGLSHCLDCLGGSHTDPLIIRCSTRLGACWPTACRQARPGSRSKTRASP